MPSLRILLVLLLIFAGAVDSATVHGFQETSDQSAGVDFATQVEPILKHRCFACHSHAAEQMEGGLTLDWKSGWQKGGARGPTIVPGDPDSSLLIQAIRHEDPDLKMPDDKLPDHEIAVLTRWVKEGAADPRESIPGPNEKTESADWWSLRPLQRPAVPEQFLPAESDERNPVDAFVLQALRSKSLQFSPPADPRTVIRRMTLDLHGLLPLPEDVDVFMAAEPKSRKNALADHLLASPRYGERWARHWMDTIHFADSHGFEHDVFRPNAWRYRDYLIQSLNQDKSWMALIREQLAADALFPESPELLPAIGFLGAGTYDHSAAATAPKSFENLDRDDMVTQTMAAFVSTTANCARCHSHKFDPISQEDYYSLQAVFAGVGKGEIPFDPDPDVARNRRRWLALQEACDSLSETVLLSAENQQRVADWERQHSGTALWTPLEVETFVSVDAARLERLPDGSILSTGPLPEQETTTVTARVSLPRVTAIRLEVLPHESLPAQGPGRAANGNFHLNDVEFRAFRPDHSEAERLAIRRATSDFDQDGWTIQHAVDGNLATAWGIHPQEGRPHYAVFELASPVIPEPGMTLHVLLRQIHGRQHILGRFRLLVTDADPDQTVALPDAALAVLKVPAEQRSPQDRILLAAAVLRGIADAQLRQLPPPGKLYAAGKVADNERGTIRYDIPRDIHILRRGDPEQPGDIVKPGALSAVAAIPDRFELPADAPESARRVALADWIAHPDNPLTWRSIANRVWHYHFGRGLCDTPSDFGRMGGLPSHPELLDWLACELRDSGGSLKHLHRLICTSQVYQQSSVVSADLLSLDPDNRLLARMVRQRLDADSYRDAVLQVSGRLDLTMGGPGIAHFSTRPGAQLTPILDYSQFDWDSAGATRRSIYRVVWRGIADPLLEPLDFPDLGLLAPVRGFSASPLQALTLLNNRFVLHHAGHLARRAEAAAPDTPTRIRHACRWVWQRDPDDEELRLLTELAERHGLQALSRALLNSNEFLFLD